MKHEMVSNEGNGEDYLTPVVNVAAAAFAVANIVVQFVASPPATPIRPTRLFDDEATPQNHEMLVTPDNVHDVAVTPDAPTPQNHEILVTPDAPTPQNHEILVTPDAPMQNRQPMQVVSFPNLLLSLYGTPAIQFDDLNNNMLGDNYQTPVQHANNDDISTTGTDNSDYSMSTDGSWS